MQGFRQFRIGFLSLGKALQHDDGFAASTALDCIPGTAADGRGVKLELPGRQAPAVEPLEHLTGILIAQPLHLSHDRTLATASSVTTGCAPAKAQLPTPETHPAETSMGQRFLPRGRKRRCRRPHQRARDLCGKASLYFLFTDCRAASRIRTMRTGASISAILRSVV